MDDDETTLYDAVGGRETFRALVDDFYRGVAGDPPLRALYPEEDLGPAADRLRMFLEQYFGGPATYSERRGHPRLRMRHAPFVIDADQRDRWLRHMLAALDARALAPELDAPIRDYFTAVADFLVNAPGE
ncbi:MAG: globin [Thermoleophilia bacterium]|nr:globin [Thermoleophilia bacterium]